MADFPSTLKPSVTQGYSFGDPRNVLTQNVQGGPPLMMLDYATGPTPFNIGLVLNAAELQVFQEFYVNDINNGALKFNMNLDDGLGIASHVVVIDSSSLNIDGSRAPIWTASFTVSIDNSTPPVVIPDGYDTATANPNLAFSDRNTELVATQNVGQWYSTYAVNPLVRDTYWEHTWLGTQLLVLYRGVVELSAFQDSTAVGRYVGSMSDNHSSSVSLQPFIDNVSQPFITTPSLVIGTTYCYRYTHSTRLIEVSTDGQLTWDTLFTIPNANEWRMAVSSQNPNAITSTAFILADIFYTVPSGYSTYDNDYTAP